MKKAGGLRKMRKYLCGCSQATRVINPWRPNLLGMMVAVLIFGGIVACSLGATGSEGTAFLPTPETAHLCLATEEWLVWETNAVIKGTERNRVQSRTYQYFLQSDIQGAARQIFSCSDTRPPRVVGVLTNGTAVFAFSDFSEHMILVDRQGRRIELSCREPQHSAVESDTPLAAYDDGVLVRAKVLNHREPVYFVPWGQPPQDLTQAVVLKFGEKIMVTDTNGIGHLNETTLFREGNTFIWAWEDWTSAHLSYFDLAERTLKVHPARPDVALVSYYNTLQACDGETAVLIVGSYGRGQCVTGFDVRTGERLPAWLDNYVVLAVRHRVAYALESRGLVAYDLMSAGEKPRIILEAGAGPPGPCIIRRGELIIWWGHKWKRIAWVAPAR